MSNLPPQLGLSDVFEHAQNNIISTFNTQFIKGVSRYDTVLQTFNGRDASIDALEELADAVNYVTQLQMENRELLAALKMLYLFYDTQDDKILEEFMEDYIPPQIMQTILHSNLGRYNLIFKQNEND